MDEPSPGDPYTWDVPLLTRELCGSPRPWAPANPQKRPDAAALAAAIQEHELDGETLLTWEDIFGSHNDLFRDLGVVKALHRMTLARAIMHLKNRSPLYRQAKQQMLSEQTAQDDGDIKLPDAEPLVDETSSNRPSAHKYTSSTTELAKITPAPSFGTPPAQESNSFSIEGTQHTSSEPPAKKRRLAPQLVTSEVRDVGRAPILTAADSVTITPDYGPTIFENGSKAVYLGKGALILTQWVPVSNLRSSYRHDSAKESEEFYWARGRKVIAPGRQLQVKRGITRLLQANSKAEKMMQDNVAPFLDHSPSPEPLSEDRILPIFGDSDDEDGYDPETIMEMEEEAAEKELPTGMLNKEAVQAILDEVIQDYVHRWNDEKLPRLQRTAHSLWKVAHMRGRNHQIARSLKRAAELDARIRTLVAEIHSQDWSADKPLRRQARCLEASIEDRQKEMWLGEMLKGRQPPKMTSAPRPSRRRVRRVADLSDSDGDFITSDSDMSGDDFPTGTAVSPIRSLASPVASLPAVFDNSVASDHAVDLTAFGDRNTDNESSVSDESSRIVVDLVTPEHGSFTNIDAAEEEFTMTRKQREIPFDRPLEIGQINVSAWLKYNDPQRLTISFIWKKSPAWKHKMFQMVRRKSPDDIWRDIILPTCESPDTANDTAIGFTRLFWQYVSCSVSSALFKNAMSPRMLETVPHKRKEFDKFLDFMKEHVIPHMPTDGSATHAPAPRSHLQKFESQDVEDVENVKPSIEADSEDDTEPDDPVKHEGTPVPASRKKSRVRPVKRNLDAEKLRAKENVRAEEQEHREHQRRQRMINSKDFTEAEARLIINLGKQGEDDSAFVSVSRKLVSENQDKPSIADRIKDHQIEGVRFMWSHLVADQGCLLAHTMGLGKTMQVITVLVAISEASVSPNNAVKDQIPKELHGQPRIFIMCPSGLVDNWKEEFAAWAPTDAFSIQSNIRSVASTTNPLERIEEIRGWYEYGGVLIIGFNLFRSLCEKNMEAKDLILDAHIVIADEAHRMKNRFTKLSGHSAEFKTSRRVALTGTPLANNVGEFFSAIDWVAPNFLGPYKEFSAIYVEPIEKGLYQDSSPAEFRKAKKKLAALERTVASKTHRLTTACLKDQLPAKLEFVITIPMKPLQAKLYHMYLESLRGLNEDMNATAQIFAVTNNLVLLCNHPKCFYQRLVGERAKHEKLSNWKGPIAIEDKPDPTLSYAFLSESLQILNRERDVGSMQHSWKVLHLIKILDECKKTKEKVLIFSQSIPTLDYLGVLLKQQGRSIAKLTGTTATKMRQNMVNEFNTSDSKSAFLISTGAGGTGLNITGASRVVIFDTKFNPVEELQAIGRAYRIGQKRNVFVYRFLAAGTFEKALHNKAIFKQQLASRVVDAENPKPHSSKFTDLLLPIEESIPFNDLSEFAGRDCILDSILAQQAREKSVNSIILTDTYEEEDPNDTALSAEERKEVENMIEMNRIRHTDPVRFALLEQELAMHQAAPQHKALAEAASRHAAPNTVPKAPVPAPFKDAMSATPPFRPYVPPPQKTQHVEAPVTSQQPQIPPLMPPQPQGASHTPLWPPAFVSSPTEATMAQMREAASKPVRIQARSQAVRHQPHAAPQANVYMGYQAPPFPGSVPPPFPGSVPPPQAGMYSSSFQTPQSVPAPSPRNAHQGLPQHQALPNSYRPISDPRPYRQTIGPPRVPGAMPEIFDEAPGHVHNNQFAGGGQRINDRLASYGQNSSSTTDKRLNDHMQLFARKLYTGAVVHAQQNGTELGSPMEVYQTSAKIAEEARQIQVSLNGGFLPDKARWNELTDKADDPQFCKDVLEGTLTPEKMVSGDLSGYDFKAPAQASTRQAPKASFSGGVKASGPQTPTPAPRGGKKGNDPNV